MSMKHLKIKMQEDIAGYLQKTEPSEKDFASGCAALDIFYVFCC